MPLRSAIGFSTRRVNTRHYALVRVQVNDGSTGIGFCYEGTQPSGLAATAVRRLLAPVLMGEDPHRTEGLWTSMYQEALLQGRAGAVMRAISAIDIALWDRNARVADLPLWRYLGADSRGTVPAYASGGYYIDGDPVEAIIDEVTRHVDAGFTAVKIKVGGRPLPVDVSRVAAARSVLGPEGMLMLDANNAWHSVPAALRAVRAFEPYDPAFIEEPFLPDDVGSHDRLGRLTTIPIATGELEAGRWRAAALLDSSVEILQVDAAVCGGITEFRRIACAAAALGKVIWPHWFHDLHMHLVGSSANSECVEFFPDSSVLNFRDIIDTQVITKAGEIVLPTTQGLGFGFDDAALRHYAIDSWA